ncbi:hypothetical protein SprV_0401632800 [Sparganum proliferum]
MWAAFSMLPLIAMTIISRNSFKSSPFLYVSVLISFNLTIKDFHPHLQSVVKLSSAGLIYAHFGKRVISEIAGHLNSDADLETLFKQVYKSFISEVDAIDNGVPISDGPTAYKYLRDESSQGVYLAAMNKIILLGIFVAAAFAAPINQSTPTPPAPADSPVAKFFGDTTVENTKGGGNDQSTPTPPAPAGKSTSPPPVSADTTVENTKGGGNDQSTPTPPAPAGKSTSPPPVSADTTAKYATDKGNASSWVDVLGGLGSSFLQGVSGVLGQVTTGGNTTDKVNDTTAKNATDRGNASPFGKLFGDASKTILQGLGGLLGQISTGGITTGGGSASPFGKLFGDASKTILQGLGGLLGQISTGGNKNVGVQVLGGVPGQGNSSVISAVKHNETKARKPDTKPVVIKISMNVLFQWIQEKKHVLARNAFAYLLDTLLNNVFEGRSKELVKEFLDIISMEATVQEAAIDKFLTENTGVIVEEILKFLTEIPDDMAILLLKLTAKHGDALIAYLIECLKGRPFEYAGYISDTVYSLADIFAMTAWMKFLRQVVIRLANQVLKKFVGEANWFYKIVNGLFPLTPEYPNDKKVESNVTIPSDNAASVKPQVLQPNLHLDNQPPVAVSDV